MLVFSRTNPPPLRDPDFVLPAKVHDPRPAVSHWAIQQDRSKVNLGFSARGSCITSSRLSARTWGLLALCHSLKTSAWPGFCLRALPGIEPCPPSCGGFHSALHQKLMLRYFPPRLRGGHVSPLYASTGRNCRHRDHDLLRPCLTRAERSPGFPIHVGSETCTE